MAIDWNNLFGYAQAQLGTPYVYGGTGNGGFDCSGFTSAVYASQGVQIGRDTSAQLKSGQVVGQDGNWNLDISNLQPGDLIFYGAPGASGPNAHVVMYIGNDQVIQAGGSNVNITQLFSAASSDEPFLGVRRYTQVVNGPAGGADPNAAVGSGPPGNTSAPSSSPQWDGQTLTIADIPAVDDYIRANWPSYSWLMDDPTIKSIMEHAAIQGLDASQVQAQIAQTPFWQHTSTAQKTYMQDKALNPGDYDFTVPGSKASQTAAHIAALAAQSGVQLDNKTIQNLATQALAYGLTDAQVQQNLGKMAGNANSGAVVQQLHQAAGQYLITPSDGAVQQWVKGIVGGTQTIQQFQAYLANQAAQKHPGMADQIAQGFTPYQITSTLRNEAANTLEMDPTQINMASDPTFSKILNFTPPGQSVQPGQVPQQRMMTVSEMDQYLKGLPAYATTQNARNQVASVAAAVAQKFGEIQ